MSKLFAGLSGWDWLEIIALLMVLSGAGITLFLRYKKSRAAFDKNGLISVEWFFKREEIESRKSKWEFRWEIVLVFGLALEIPATVHSISESARLNNKNLELQSELNGVTNNVAQISTSVSNIDPYKQPITSISFIIVLDRKTNGLDISGLKTLDKEIILTQLLNNPIGLVDPIFTNGGIAEVFLGVKGHVMQNGKSQLEIATEARQVNQFLIERDNTTEKFDVLYFNSNEKSFMNFLSFTNPTGLSLEDLDEVVIDMFNPYNPTEVVKGVVICNVNGYSGATKYFIFPPQIRNTNSWAVFALRAPDSFNWLNFVRSWY
jgi:hypothetical protein